jgi:tRNA-splicing ligase RtcB
VKIWARPEDVEDAALAQLMNVAALPWVFSHVAAMPDVHWGVGATVGSVIAMKGALAPAAVGVDIGCGMAAARLDLNANDLPDSLREIRSTIERVVPVGFAKHAAPPPIGDDDLFHRWHVLTSTFKDLDESCQELLGNTALQLGTLGGGNHFIELCLDEADRVWLMLHSGSRNIGNRLARVHMARAKTLAHNEELPDPDLAVFLAGTPEMAAYRRDLYWAQEYAALNRRVMLARIMRVLSFPVPLDLVECHHNYVAEETHFGEDVYVTRKGAIRAHYRERGIIPGSMGTDSFIVRGLGCEQSFQSASHGAGRRMGRKAAKRTYTVDDLVAQTAGVECRKDEGVLDEIPAAYKDIDQVMANQQDLVAIEHRLRAVLCVKG